MQSSYSRIFLASLPEAERTHFSDASALELSLKKHWHETKKKWPDWEVSIEEFLPHWASRLVGLEAPLQALEKLHVPELYLAFACSLEKTDAIAVFHKLYVAKIGAALRRMRIDEALVDDLLQMLLFRVLVGSEERKAKILSYGGRGSLAGWLRVIAVREARTVLKKQARELPVSNVEVFAAKSTGAFSAVLELADDPEFAYIKQHFRSELKTIFPLALQALELRDRNLLRLDILDGLNHQQIAKIYNVHRTTVLRWLDQAEQNLSEEIHRQIKDKLDLGDTDLESLLRVVRSHLSISIGCAFLDDEQSES
ncbi:MAG: sigma-70 family RNA polymerase sigma factor [Kofleriaceae bacterium]|nr:sigma-70 family RNA polymerase sigma factor [Kofleriaceae bacterium]